MWGFFFVDKTGKVGVEVFQNKNNSRERSMRNIMKKALFIAALCGLSLQAAAVGHFEPLKGQDALRVCADKFNMPFSNFELEGIENKMAQMIADELDIPLEYTWFPQRLGFIRNTIKRIDRETGRYRCDLVVGVPTQYDMLATTQSYFSSIESMVYRSGEGYELKTVKDIAALAAEGKSLRIGLFDRAVATESLINNGLGDNIEYYRMMPGHARTQPSRIVEAVASGEVDVAFVWGPIAGYFAGESDTKMTVVPLTEEDGGMAFSLSMGVRYPDKSWKALLNKIIDAKRDDINALLTEYHFPLVATPAAKEDDD